MPAGPGSRRAAPASWRHRPGDARGGAVPAIGERAGLMPWAPVWMSVGIGLWFLMPQQPGPAANLLALAALCGGLCLWWHPSWQGAGRLRGVGIGISAEGARLAGFALIFLAAGFAVTSLRAARVEAPVLGFRYYGPVEGRVIAVDRSGRDRIRLTLDRVRLARMDPAKIPRRVRLSLPDGVRHAPAPGAHVMTTGHLGPPPGPTEPGGFDFRRSAWFAGLGAIGYTRNPVLLAGPPDTGRGFAMHRLRMELSATMQQRIGGQAGAVAAALMTGDRSHIAEATNQVMRDSNLYHIISISGLHMGMLAAFVYAALRLCCVAVQAATGRLRDWPAHKLAACGAIAAALMYLWLSGGGVATERAFLMVAVMLGAILADRRALSLRTVSLAAVVILTLAPEALLTPGFQMSFAATVALILIYAPWQRWGRAVPLLLRPALMLILSSAIAGLATTPIAAAHFSRMAHYGILANLLVVPVTGILIMPMGPVAALLSPVGLEGPALWLMGLGTRWMLAVGGWIAGLDGAVSYVVMPPAGALPMMGLGALLALLCGRADLPFWRNPRVGTGGLLIAAAALLWIATPRPDLLISRDGDAVGLMTQAGRALSKPKGGAFTVGEWLEKDGDRADRAEAAERAGWTGPVKARQARLGGLEILHLTGKGSAEAASRLCGPEMVIVSNQEIGPLSGDCLLLDRRHLRQSGAMSVTLRDGAWHWRSTATVTGNRPWSH